MATKAAKLSDNFITSRRERGSYGLYFTGQNIYYTLVANYLVTYMMFLGVNLQKIAGIMLAVKVWDAVNDVLFGVIFDKVKFKSGRKCLPWLKISTAFMAFVTIFLFGIPQSTPETGKLIWFTIAYILWDTAYTLCDVPIFSMVTTMTNNLDERNTLMSQGRIYSAAGGGLAGILLTVLVSEKVGVNFGLVAAILSVMGVLLMLPICIFGRERNYTAEETEESFTLKQMFRYLRKNKYLLFYYSAYIVSNCFVTNVSMSLFTSYYLFGNSIFNLLLSLLSAAPALIIALFLPKIIHHFDKFKLYMLCNIINIILGIIIYFVGWKNITLFVILSVLRAIPGSAIGVLMFMFTPDCAEYGRYKTGTDAKGITFAIQTFSSKIGSAVSSSLGLFVLGLFGWVSVSADSFADLEAQAVVQSDMALNGLWVTYALLPVIGAVLSLVFLAFYKLNDKDVQIMADCNAGKITRDEAEHMLSRKY